MKTILILLLSVTGNAHAYDRTITQDNIFGCKTQEYFEKLRTIAQSGDNVAFRKGYVMGVTAGECDMLKKGTKVDVTETKVFSGLNKVRPMGDINEYWTITEAVR